jgi:hypothetical protein
MAWMGKFLFVVLMSQNSSVGIVNKLYAGELRNCGLILVGDEIFLFSTIFALALGSTQSPIQWVLTVLSAG